MKNTIFTGAGVAIITPMNDDGSINYEGFAENIEYQINNGTDAIIVCGTTGEASTMTDEEHIECIRFTVEKTKGRVPVIAGTGSNDTKYAVELSKTAQEKGADGLLLVTPYYNKASQKGLIAHFGAISEAVDIPIILYNIPGRTGVSIEIDTYKRLAEFKNIVAQYSKVKPEEMTGEMRFREDLGFTSLDFMSFLGELEDTFDIELDENEVTKITTLEEALKLLEELQ